MPWVQLQLCLVHGYFMSHVDLPPRTAILFWEPSSSFHPLPTSIRSLLHNPQLLFVLDSEQASQIKIKYKTLRQGFTFVSMYLLVMANTDLGDLLLTAHHCPSICRLLLFFLRRPAKQGPDTWFLGQVSPVPEASV
jgi:hypothetical protein